MQKSRHLIKQMDKDFKHFTIITYLSAYLEFEQCLIEKIAYSENNFIQR